MNFINVLGLYRNKTKDEIMPILNTQYKLCNIVVDYRIVSRDYLPASVFVKC